MINNVILVGRLAQDPELRETEKGKNVCTITLAINKPFRNGLGEYETDFIKCTLWENLAINISEYCQKGATVGIKGRVSTKVQEIEGKKITTLEVIAEKITFLSSKSN